MEPPTSQLVDSLLYQVSHSHHIRSLLKGWDGTDPHLCVCVRSVLVFQIAEGHLFLLLTVLLYSCRHDWYIKINEKDS